MKKLFGMLFAVAASLLSVAPAAAQVATVKVPMCLQVRDSTKTYVPCTGMVPVDPSTGNTINWSEAFSSNILGASNKTPVVNALSSASASGSFTPIAGRSFNITITGGTGVVAQVERSFDGGASWVVKYPDSLRVSLPESFSDVESELNVRYRVNVLSLGGGTVNVRISQ